MSLYNYTYPFKNETIRRSILLSAVLLGVVTVETIPLPISMYIAPATSLLALASLPLLYWHYGRVDRTPLGYAVGIFYGFALVHSLVFLAVDYVTISSGFLRASLWLQQVIALSAGVAVFAVLRVTLRPVGSVDRARYLVVGSLVSLIPACLSLLWVVTGVELFAVIPRLVRAFAPTGFDGLWRTTGFASEPSHFAFLIVTVLLPAVMIGYPHPTETTRPRRRWGAMGLLLVVVLFATLSTTGMLLLVAFIGAFTVLSGRWKLALVGVGLAVLAIALFIVVFPHSYLTKQMTFLVTGGWRHSINTRFFSTIGPLMGAFSSVHGFLGYGLGGTAAHSRDLLPPESLAGLAHNSGATIALKTLLGRVIAELGMIGLALIGMVFVAAYSQLARLHGYRFAPWEWSLQYRVIGAALLTAVFGHGIGNGSFAIPVVWLWVAWIDADCLQDAVGR